MNTHEIQVMLAYQKVTEVPEQAKVEIYNLILKVYTLFGLIRNRTEKDLKIELEIISQQLWADMGRITVLRTLRVPELAYIFNLGISGELGEIKGVNYPLFINWMKLYATSAERKAAFQNLENDNHRKQLEQKTNLTDFDKEQLVKDHINKTFLEYLQNPDSVRVKQATGGIQLSDRLSSLLKSNHPQKPGDIIDLAGVKSRYLTAKGLKNPSESLEDFFIRMKNSKKVKIF